MGKRSRGPTLITPEQLAATGSEHGEQAAVFQWAALNRPTYPELEWLFAIPNGGWRGHIVTAMKIKAEGVKRGVPDMALLQPRGQYHGCLIEMKRETKGETSDAQDKWADHLRLVGYSVYVCHGWKAAVAALQDYLGPRTSTAWWQQPTR